jgi:hypothetical protein
MSNLSLLSDTNTEGKPPRWRHWWERATTPSSSGSPPIEGHVKELEADDGQEEAITDDGHEEEVEAIVGDDHD